MNSYTDIDGVPAAADRGSADRRCCATPTASTAPSSPTTSRSRSCETPAPRGRRPGRTRPGWPCEAGIDVELPTVARVRRRRCWPARRGEVDRREAGRPGAARACCGRSASSACSTPDWARRRGGATVDLDDAGVARARARAGASARSCCSPTTAPCRWRRGRGSRWSVRSADTYARRCSGCYSFPMHVARRTTPSVDLGLRDPHPARRPRATRRPDVVHALGCPVLGGDRRRASPRPSPRRRGRRRLRRGARATSPGCSATARRARAATSPTCACPGARRSCSRRCSRPAPRWCAVLLVGRPYDLSRYVDRLAAVGVRLLPGRGGRAGARRRADRSGQPVGTAAGQLPRCRRQRSPSTYLASPLGHRSEVTSVDPTPLFPFGHGLSYGAATWASGRPPPPVRGLADRRRQREVSVELGNEATAGLRGRPGLPARPRWPRSSVRCSSSSPPRASTCAPGQRARLVPSACTPTSRRSPDATCPHRRARRGRAARRRVERRRPQHGLLELTRAARHVDGDRVLEPVVTIDEV